MLPIYLDYNATTPLDPAVVDAMLPYLREEFGNPSSSHAYGKTAHDAVEQDVAGPPVGVARLADRADVHEGLALV